MSEIHTKPTEPDCLCDLDDLTDLTIMPYGWVMIRRQPGDLRSFGIKYLSEGFDALAELARGEAARDAMVEARGRLLSLLNDMPIKGKWFRRVSDACGPLTDFLGALAARAEEVAVQAQLSDKDELHRRFEEEQT